MRLLPLLGVGVTLMMVGAAGKAHADVGQMFTVLGYGLLLTASLGFLSLWLESRALRRFNKGICPKCRCVRHNTRSSLLSEGYECQCGLSWFPRSARKHEYCGYGI